MAGRYRRKHRRGFTLDDVPLTIIVAAIMVLIWIFA